MQAAVATLQAENALWPQGSDGARRERLHFTCNRSTLKSLRWILSALVVLPACSKGSAPLAVPDAAETTSIEVILLPHDGRQRGAHCTVRDREAIQHIIDCMTPERASASVEQATHTFHIGKLGLHGRRGPIWVDFFDCGKSPLIFRIGTTAYIRGGQTYLNYRADHKRLYGIDSEAIDEGLGFYRKLLAFCANEAAIDDNP
jgi:hypothetical protein